MLRLLARRVSAGCGRAGPTQQVGGVVLYRCIVYSQIDAPRADRASVSQVLVI
jgi:hypothetical protein